MSERRQLALLFAGLVVLTAVGIVGATIFPEDCEDLAQIGELDLRFTDAADALPLSAEDGAAVEAFGEAAGIGDWRGAVALPPDAEILRSEFGFFVVTEDAFVVLRPSMGVVSAPRGRTGLDVIPAGTSIALRAGDGETGVYNGEYELDRCGELPTDGDVLTVDRGFALLTTENGAELVTLSGNRIWEFSGFAGEDDGAIVAGLVVEDAALLQTEDQLILRRDEGMGNSSGSAIDLGEDGRAAGSMWLDAFDDTVVLRGDEPGAVATVAVRFPAPEGGAGEPTTSSFMVGSAGSPTGLDEVLDAALSPRGSVVLGTVDGQPAVTTLGAFDSSVRDAVSPIENPATVVPAGLDVRQVMVSQDGHVGLLVADDDGARALLVYGRLLPDVAED